MKNYKKYYIIPAPPEEVYLALTVPTTLLLWTGEDAVMSTVPESEFSLWGGSIEGRNIEFVEGKKLCSNGILAIRKKPLSLLLFYIRIKQILLRRNSAIQIFPMKRMKIWLKAGTMHTSAHCRSFMKANN